jgi:hypothetical protein
MKTLVGAFAAGACLMYAGMRQSPVGSPNPMEVRAQRFVLCDAEGKERGLFGFNDWLGGPCVMLLNPDGQPKVWIGLVRGSSGESESAASLHLESEPGDAIITMATDSMQSFLAISADDRREMLLRTDADRAVLRLGSLDYDSLEPKTGNSIELQAADGTPNGAKFEIKNAAGEISVSLPR